MRRVLPRSGGRRARKAAQPTVSLAARQPQFLVNQGVAVFFILGFSAEKTRFSNRFLTIRRIRPLKMYDGLKISLAFLDCEEYNFYVRNKADIGVKK